MRHFIIFKEIDDNGRIKQEIYSFPEHVFEEYQIRVSSRYNRETCKNSGCAGCGLTDDEVKLND